MNSVEIKILMLRKGLTQEELAKRADYTVSAINNAINKGQGSDRLLKAIAEVIDKDPCELWPERFPECKCDSEAA